MAPLLVTGLTAVAGNLLDKWNEASANKQAAANAAAAQPAFQDALGKAVSMSGGSAKLARQVKLETLRQALMNSPEVKTAMDTSDPLHPPTLSLDETGNATLTSADGRTKALQLSPDTQAMAKELAGMEAAGAVKIALPASKKAGAAMAQLSSLR